MTAVVELQVASSTDAWRAVGLQIIDDVSWIGGIRLRFAPVDDVAVVAGWTLSDSPARPATIDGLATSYADDVELESWSHPLGATAFDHVVVMTSSIERTCGAIEAATGAPLKRIRETGTVRQGFHRLGPLVVEVVETSAVTAELASFWGFVLIVDDIHDVCTRLGVDLLSPPRAAVQPGRLIASFRRDAGLGLPIAIMSR